MFEFFSLLTKIHKQSEIKKHPESLVGREADKVEDGQGADKNRRQVRYAKKIFPYFLLLGASQHLHPCHDRSYDLGYSRFIKRYLFSIEVCFTENYRHYQF